MIPYGKHFIDEDDIEAVVNVLRHGYLTQGPAITSFEEALSDYVGAKFAVAVSSCTAGLHLAALAAELGCDDTLITSPISFVASANAGLYTGAKIAFADINPNTVNMDVDALRECLSDNPSTKVVVPVHFAGLPCDMTSIMEIATEYNLKVIEDCAHAIESEYQGKKVGTIGDFGCFSFYVTKNIVTGEGGMVLARKAEDVSRLKILGLHGMSKDAWNRFGNDQALSGCGMWIQI